MTILFTLYERHCATFGLAVVTVFSTTVTESHNVPPSFFPHRASHQLHLLIHHRSRYQPFDIPVERKFSNSYLSAMPICPLVYVSLQLNFLWLIYQSFIRELCLVEWVYPMSYRRVLRRKRHQGVAALVLGSKHLLRYTRMARSLMGVDWADTPRVARIWGIEIYIAVRGRLVTLTGSDSVSKEAQGQTFQ